MIECNALQARVFYAWRQYLNDKNNRHHHKNNAVEKTWHLLVKGSKQELKRSFDIWKENRQHCNAKARKYANLLLKGRKVSMSDAFTKWKSYCGLLEYAVRTRVL